MRFPFFGSALLAVLFQSSEAVTQLTDGNIGTDAVPLWISNETIATAKYGDITDWDTSNVTNMDNLFCGADGNTTSYPAKCSLLKADFNDDISKWDVASVTDTRRVLSAAARSLSLCLVDCWLSHSTLPPPTTATCSASPTSSTSPFRRGMYPKSTL